MSTKFRPGRVLAASGIAAALALGASTQAAQAATTSSASTVLAKIRYCESGGNYQAQNSSSTASGAYQFLDSTWQGLSASKGYARAKDAPASVQDAAALELYAAQGTTPWASSQSCWSSLGAVPTSSSSSASTGSSTGPSSSAATARGTSTARGAAGSAIRSSDADGAARPAARPEAPGTRAATTSVASTTMRAARRTAPVRPASESGDAHVDSHHRQAPPSSHATVR